MIQTQVLMRQIPIASTFGDSTTNDTLWEWGFLWWDLLWSSIFTYQTVICRFVLKVVWSTLRLSLVATVLNRPRGLCSHHSTRPALNPSYVFVCLFVCCCVFITMPYKVNYFFFNYMPFLMNLISLLVSKYTICCMNVTIFRNINSFLFITE